MKRLILLLALVMGFVACTEQAPATLDREAMRDAVLARITGAEMPTEVLSILDFGAVADGVTDCKPAFDSAMQRAEELGGARIVVPAGDYWLCGPIHFVSRVCLELQEGATLKFNPEPSCYLPVVATSWEGTFLYNYSPFIYGRGLHDISIVGKGVIDGNAATTFSTWRALQRPSKELSRKYNHEQTPVEERIFGEGHYLRPHLIQFYECERITLEGVFITNAPFWCVHLLKSKNIICDGLRYDAKLVNNDGIDPEYAQDVLIQNIEFNNGDDNVAIKCGRDHDGRTTAIPSSGIVIRNCRFKGLHGVVLGSEMSAGVENVFIENCTYAGYCKRGLYIKTNPDRGGFIRNIFCNNCEFGEVEDLIFFTSMYAREGLDNHYFTDVHDIYVEDVTCEKARAAAIVLQGTAVKKLRNVHFTRVEVEEAAIGLSMENTEAVAFTDCILGGRAGAPTTASHKDKVFEGDKKK